MTNFEKWCALWNIGRPRAGADELARLRAENERLRATNIGLTLALGNLSRRHRELYREHVAGLYQPEGGRQ